MRGQDKKNKVIVILGQTSSGKTGLAVKLAALFNGEIVSADSRQVYQGMDIGSGKDLGEYTIFEKGKKKKIKHHLIDVVSPNTKFSLAKYQKLAHKALDDILSRGKLPFLVGGSGLYLQAIVDNYQLSGVQPDPKKRQELEALSKEELQAKLEGINRVFFNKLNSSDRNNPRRLLRYIEIFSGDQTYKAGTKKSKYNFLLLGLAAEKKELQKRIHDRLLHRLEKEDLLGEIKRLHENGVSYKRLESFGLEYKYGALYLQKKLDYDLMVQLLFQAICRFAKKQNSWFSRWEKQNRKINWLSGWSEAKKIISDF